MAAVLAMVGVAVGLGNFWRFPYLVGQFGGAAFVLFYLLVVAVIGVPGLMAEWTLGRHTRRGTVGAFERAGMPFGRAIGWFLFVIMLASSAYYTNAVGWVLAHAVASLLSALGLPAFNAASVLPPAQGFDATSFLLQIVCTLTVLGCAWVVLSRGLREGIEAMSRLVIPALSVILVILIVRGLTLPCAAAGVHWYLFKFDVSGLTGSVMVAALGQVVFSIGLGGVFMVVYGSYLSDSEKLARSAFFTAGADTLAGLLAGLAIFPAVFALGLEPGTGPGLIFDTLPRVFAAIPAGAIFATLFFAGLFAVALLSDIAAFEVVIAGITDNTRLTRRRALATVLPIVFILSLPPMINMRIFVPWDLTFGSGMQTLGALLSVLAVGWSIQRSVALEQLARHGTPAPRLLYLWLRFVVPGCILLVGVWWLLTDVLHVAGGV
jgi:NSS family neurotransmitter:Na+ symporter